MKHHDQLRNYVTHLDGGLLPEMLSVAVPLYQLQFRQLTPGEREEIARESLDTLLQNGEAILRRIPGKTAASFNALAKGIACLSFQPGGVTVFGQHYEVKDAHHEG